MAAMECPLCRKLPQLEQQPPEDLVWHFPHSVAVLGDWQYYHGYCLLVSRRHAGELNHLMDSERSAYLAEMCLLARAIQDCFQPRKLNYELLGNQVAHLHWHVIPRYEDDPDRLDPIWVVLDRARADKARQQRLREGPVPRQQTAQLIRQRLQHLLETPS